MKGDRRRRRRHTDDFKANLVAACSRPGVSIASVALANGIDANLLRRWIEQGGQRLPSADSVDTTVDMPRDQAKAAFVPVQIGATRPPTASDIRIELKRGATTVRLSDPCG
ncbi:transposase [Variovorax sp. J31P207]|uniref:transposase n=1 Tax=Variovorax sp. J31P207 TaxID=3053510 RepID=UPI00257842CE|nr:transposase [Variovorax sp. J31P207]MDM0071698.1 transposase [Variovorax sp. J31P207]